MEEARFLWPLGFGLSLTGALLTHVYDVYLVLPFAAVELYYLAKDRRMSWPIASAIALPLIGVLPLYLSLVRMYRATVPPTFAPASHSVLRPFFTEAMSPGHCDTPACHRASRLGWKAPIEVSASSLSHSAAGDPSGGTFCLHSPSWVGGRRAQPWPLSPPLFPVGHRRLRNSPRLRKLSKLSIALVEPRGPGSPGSCAHSCFFSWLAIWEDRSISESRTRTTASPGRAPTSVLAPRPRIRWAGTRRSSVQLAMVQRAMRTFWSCRISSTFIFTNMPHPQFRGGSSSQPPQRQTCFSANTGAWPPWPHVSLRTTTFAPFLASHDRFFVYAKSPGVSSAECGDCVQEFLNAGFTLKSARRDTSGVLYEYEK